MRLRAWASLALSSLLIGSLAGATRPRYGGTLTVELSTSWTTLDPAEPSADAKREALLPVFAETLVRRTAKGDIATQLAISWQRDADRKRWRFSLRPRVFFHDGEPLTAASAAPSLRAALKKKYPDVSVLAGGQALTIRSEHPMPDLLSELAQPTAAVYRNKSAPIGTGPFRVSGWDQGHRLTLAAFEDYWGGRPYLDSVVINLGTTRARADIFDLPVGSTRRILPDRTRTVSSRPRELLALVAPDLQPAVRQALALAIDRAPIVNVLTQKKGEAAFGILPQWLTGYAFLFTVTPDPAHAKEMVASLRLSPLTLSYPANDTFARSVAERVALNAHDAGIEIRPVTAPTGNLRLLRLILDSADATEQLARLAGQLGMPDHGGSLYESERALLDDDRVIPLVYLPDVYGVGARVHNWDSGPFVLHLENVWVEQP